MMAPCPGIRRGTDCMVPRVPGLVSDTVVPEKSSGVILLVWILRMRSSYASTKARKSRVSASLMHGTRSVRLPSLFSWSTASPSPTCLWWTTPGFPVPSASATNAEFSAGTSQRARTTA